MFNVRKRRDVAGDPGAGSLDFGRQLNLLELPGLPEDQSITLWGPGVVTPENPATPASILSHSLHTWRKENAQLSPAKAAEELDKLYESLPQETLDLTFQDMIGRNNSPKKKSFKGAKKEKSTTKSNAINGEAVGQTVQNVPDEKNNGPNISVAGKIALMLSPRRVFSSSKKVQLTHEELDRLMQKRQRKSPSSDREGLYSASSTPCTTPPTSFRRVSPLASPRLSPTPSFTDYMLQIDRHSFERELVKSAGFLESFLDDTAAPPPPVDQEKGSPRLPMKSQSPSQKKFLSDPNDCCTCTRANVFFVKTTCWVCGKSYCPSCKDIEMIVVRAGRRCRKDCLPLLSAANGTADERHQDREQPQEQPRRKQPSWWWPFASCMSVAVVEDPIINRS